ncbi:MAG: hypothetical protein H6684_14725 [Deltaproteobacteria bacterium]|nr:hypothetical protein [Deltaproteobacteria bacterium]
MVSDIEGGRNILDSKGFQFVGVGKQIFEFDVISVAGWVKCKGKNLVRDSATSVKESVIRIEGHGEIAHCRNRDFIGYQRRIAIVRFVAKINIACRAGARLESVRVRRVKPVLFVFPNRDLVQ